MYGKVTSPDCDDPVSVNNPLTQMLMFTILKSVRHKSNIHIFDHYDDNVDLIDKKSLERARLEAYDNDMAKVCI